MSESPEPEQLSSLQISLVTALLGTGVLWSAFSTQAIRILGSLAGESTERAYILVLCATPVAALLFFVFSRAQGFSWLFRYPAMASAICVFILTACLFTQPGLFLDARSREVNAVIGDIVVARSLVYGHHMSVLLAVCLGGGLYVSSKLWRSRTLRRWLIVTLGLAWAAAVTVGVYTFGKHLIGA